MSTANNQVVVDNQPLTHQSQAGPHQQTSQKQNTLANQKSLQMDELQNIQGGEQKKRKKRKHKQRKHSPQYYQRLKALKQNRKKQSLWDNRFHLGQIPLREKGVIQHPVKSYKKFNPKKLNQGYKTIGTNKQGKSKSFNIRVVGNHDTVHKQRPSQTYFDKKQQLKEHYRPKLTEQNKKVEKKEEQKQKLIAQVNKVYQQKKFEQCHHKYLIQMIKNSQSKNLSNIIYKEIQELNKQSNNCSFVQNAIKKRQQILNQLSQQKFVSLNQAKQDHHKITEKQWQMIQTYRNRTIKAIEAILNWKSSAQQTYLLVTKVKTSLIFEYKNNNYLLKLKSDNNFMLKEFLNEEDPFLLSYNITIKNGDKEQKKLSKQDIVRIRACQLLLLQQTVKQNANHQKQQDVQKN